MRVDPIMEDPLATLLQVAVMDIMEAGITDIIPTVSEAGMRRGIATVHLPVLSGAE
jgi:hypothetical protein